MTNQTKSNALSAYQTMNNQINNGTCPHCGYCPTCGRRNNYYPWYPYYGTPIYNQAWSGQYKGLGSAYAADQAGATKKCTH